MAHDPLVTDEEITGDPGPRLKNFRVTREMLAQFFKAGTTAYEITENPLPDDARIIWIDYEVDLGIATLTIESGEFDPVPVGVRVPDFGDLTGQRIVTAREVEPSLN